MTAAAPVDTAAGWRGGWGDGLRYGALGLPLAFVALPLYVVLPNHYASTFGVPLATSSGRGGTAYGIGVSLGTTILYLLLFKVSGALGQAGTLSPLTAAWLPNALFFGAALVLLRRVRT